MICCIVLLKAERAPRRVQTQRTTKKWGSPSTNGTLTFSSDLLSKPRCVGEAVIAHELVHLKAPNHGPLFRSLFRAMLPGADAVTKGELSCG